MRSPIDAADAHSASAQRSPCRDEHEHMTAVLAAPPFEGAANDALVAFLAESLRLPKRQVTIVSGGHSRTKRILVSGVLASEVNDRLAPLLPER